MRVITDVISRGISSVGRAPALQAGCQRFESAILHRYNLNSTSKYHARQKLQ